MSRKLRCFRWIGSLWLSKRPNPLPSLQNPMWLFTYDAHRAISNLEYQVSYNDTGNQTGASTHRQLTEAESLALDTLNASLTIQERNQYGGFWYVSNTASHLIIYQGLISHSQPLT